MTEEEFDQIAFDKAEDLWRFVGMSSEFESFCHKSQTEDLSVAEYVFRYRLPAFMEYIKNKQSVGGAPRENSRERALEK